MPFGPGHEDVNPEKGVLKWGGGTRMVDPALGLLSSNGSHHRRTRGNGASRHITGTVHHHGG